MKILSAIIIAPHMHESGAINAGKCLSAATAEYCQVDIAIMAFDEKVSLLDKARLLERKSSNFLSFTKELLPNKFRTLFYRSDIPSLISQGDYDLVHIHNPIPALEMKRVAQACITKNIPYVVSTHGFVEVTSGGSAYSLKHLHEKLAWKFFLENPLNYVIKNATKIFALSPLEYPMLEQLGVDNQKLSVVTNGVNHIFYSRKTATDINLVAERFGLPKLADKKNPVCIYLGNHTKNKGLEILLDAFTQSKKAFTLIVCGKKRDIIDYDSYLQKCHTHQHIVFTDRVSNEEIISLFQYSDLFVYPTLSDTLPLVILEAMASGLPILSTQVGGIPYQVDANSGVLVEAGNANAVTEAFEMMTENLQQLREMGTCAYHAVKSKFDWHQSGQLAFTNYTEILHPYQAQYPVKSLIR